MAWNISLINNRDHRDGEEEEIKKYDLKACTRRGSLSIVNFSGSRPFSTYFYNYFTH